MRIDNFEEAVWKVEGIRIVIRPLTRNVGLRGEYFETA
jgi:hypothetical protein